MYRAVRGPGVRSRVPTRVTAIALSAVLVSLVWLAAGGPGLSMPTPGACGPEGRGLALLVDLITSLSVQPVQGKRQIAPTS